MKEIKDGYQYSKRHTIIYKDAEAGRLDNFKNEIGWTEPDVDTNDIDGIIDMACQKARAVLAGTSKEPPFKRDTAEDLAARIISRADAYKQDRTPGNAFWFGFELAMASVYDQYVSEKKKGREASKGKGSGWAEPLAALLVRAGADKPAKIKKRLKNPVGVNGWTISLIDGRLQATRPDKATKIMTVEYFQRTYIK